MASRPGASSVSSCWFQWFTWNSHHPMYCLSLRSNHPKVYFCRSIKAATQWLAKHIVGCSPYLKDPEYTTHPKSFVNLLQENHQDSKPPTLGPKVWDPWSFESTLGNNIRMSFLWRDGYWMSGLRNFSKKICIVSNVDAFWAASCVFFLDLIKGHLFLSDYSLGSYHSSHFHGWPSNLKFQRSMFQKTRKGQFWDTLCLVEGLTSIWVNWRELE